MMVGAVECMIKEWGAKPGLVDIYSYFEKQSNESRIEMLVKAFQMRGISADPDVFEHFLAIKYIRNAYVHRDWSEPQRVFVEQRGFRGSLLGFEERHLIRMRRCYDEVMGCLGRANLFNTAIEAHARRSRQNSKGASS